MNSVNSFQLSIIINVISCASLAAFALTAISALPSSTPAPLPAAKSFIGYESSYAFLQVDVPGQSEPKKYCINYQGNRELPNNVQLTPQLHVGWLWPGAERPGNLNICNAEPFPPFVEHQHRGRLPSPADFAQDQIVPINYRSLHEELVGCLGYRYGETNRLIKFQVDKMKTHNARNILFVMKRGKKNYYGHHDFLYSSFSSPELNNSAPDQPAIFFIYEEIFDKDILPLLNSTSGLSKVASSVVLRIYRPDTSGFKFPIGMAGLLFLALGAIVLGSMWSKAASPPTPIQTPDLVSSTSSSISSPSAIVTGLQTGQQQNQHNLQQQKAQNNESERQMVPSEEERNQHQRNQGECISAQSSSLGAAGDDALQTVPISAKNGDADQTTATDKGDRRRGRPADQRAVEQMSPWYHCLYVLFAMCFVVATLVLAFIFRPFAVSFFNLFLMVMGSQAMHSCLYKGIYKPTIGARFGDLKLFSIRQLFFCCFPPDTTHFPYIFRWLRCHCVKRRLRLVSFILFSLSLALCICWYINRAHVNSFVLLDLICFCFCVYAIKSFRIRSLRLLVFLMGAMLFYDLFMVFITPFLSPNGCSVMIEVATGMGCSPTLSSTSPGYSLPHPGPLNARNDVIIVDNSTSLNQFSLPVDQIQNNGKHLHSSATFHPSAASSPPSFRRLKRSEPPQGHFPVEVLSSLFSRESSEASFSSFGTNERGGTGINTTSEQQKEQKSTFSGLVPVAPFEQNIPEPLALLFRMPRNTDPMSECYDSSVEGQIKQNILGLGDVIIPGFFIAYCFYIDSARALKRRQQLQLDSLATGRAVHASTFPAYAIVSLIGYTAGMLATFIAVDLMKRGQPALIYLVPFTLIPVLLLATYHRIIGQLWRGTY